MKNEIIKMLAKQCADHEHRGCECTPSDAKNCWGALASDIEKRFSLTHIANDVHQNAVEKGWWEKDRSLLECIALMHSELSEAVEDGRNGRGDNETYYEGDKPCGIPSEFADVIIRILDYCANRGIDIQSALFEKMKYNKSRPYRHGGKKA